MPKLPEIEQQCEHSIYSKYDLLLLTRRQQNPQWLPSETISSLLSNSHETMVQQNDPLSIEEHKQERIIKSNDKHLFKSESGSLSESEIRWFELTKEKFERRQPIDIVFGMNNTEVFV